MNKSLIVALLVVNLCLSSAISLSKNTGATFNIFNDLKRVELDDFGKKILDTIDLQLKGNSPLGDIAKMLAEIRSDLVLQQKNDDQTHAERETECADEINEFNRRINQATIQKENAEGEIVILTGQVQQLQGDIRNKAAQVDILNVREVDLRNSRDQDAEDFDNRQRQSHEVVAALEIIIEKLQTINAEDNNSEAVLAELGSIGSSNPILALVEIASTFSQQSLDTVVAKLNELRTSLEAAIEDDKVNEASAKGEYEVLLGEITSTRKQISNAL